SETRVWCPTPDALSAGVTSPLNRSAERTGILPSSTETWRTFLCRSHWRLFFSRHSAHDMSESFTLGLARQRNPGRFCSSRFRFASGPRGAASASPRDRTLGSSELFPLGAADARAFFRARDRSFRKVS